MHAARDFLRCSDSSLVVDGRINGEVLSTDPVPQAGSAMQIHTELAWEMEPKALQQHRLHRTPVKLQVRVAIRVLSVARSSSSREQMGSCTSREQMGS